MNLLAAEQKLLHRMAKTPMQEQWLSKATEVSSLKQKLFSTNLQGPALPEQLQSVPAKQLSPAAQTSSVANRGLAGIGPQHSPAVSTACSKGTTITSGTKRSSCMHHFSSMKPKHSDLRHIMNTAGESEATEHSRAAMHASEE